jgi:predicted RNA-binding Zn-ribbon protein involved in translation (DUF1610 family)
MDDQIMNDLIKFMMAENKAFKERGLETGRVEFVCPVCGGQAVGNRYEYNGRIHGLGSGCNKCSIKHS